jgi:hypothetical protein
MPMRRSPALPLAVLLALVALLSAAAPSAFAAKRPGVITYIKNAATAGEIDAATRTAWLRDWADARKAAKRLSGIERSHLAGVVANTKSLAKRRALRARLRPAMLIVTRNVEFFWRERRRAPANATRTTFPGSQLVFQLYAGSGWQLQPLANLGTLNALSKRKRITKSTRAWADELLAHAVRRNGAIAFEYLFPFSGGKPGWASAMPQAVALEAYTRLGKVEEAQKMLKLFLLDTPKGFRVETGPGREFFVMYPQSPRLLIGNGFAQVVLSLDAYAKLVDDPVAHGVYERALAEARAGMADYDTGAWSRYYHEPGSLRGSESDLHYHQLFKQFLEQLCDRIGGEPFCSMAENFDRYEDEPVRFGTARIRATKTIVEGRVYVSKRSTIRATLWRGATAVRTVTLAGKRGTFRVRFTRPNAKGTYRISFDATALTGQRSSTEATRSLARRRR